MLAIVVLSSAVVSGGWLVERGLLGGAARAGGGPHLFDEVYDHVSREYVDTLSDSTLYTRAARGLVEELHDPHSTYLSPDFLRLRDEHVSGRDVGVGARIDVRDGWVTIVTAVVGGPAFDAGIRSGDRVVEVDSTPLSALRLDEAQDILRGQAGSAVRLTVERPGVAGPLKFALTRGPRVPSAQHAVLLGNGVGYVALTELGNGSALQLRRAIDSLRAVGMKTVILDLRRDAGGVLAQGVAVAELFLNTGQRIVSTRGRIRGSSLVYDARSPQPWPQLPLAVLIDSNTAGAAEVVAGALQDHDRALLVGTPTYGSGNSQTVYPLGNRGALTLTTARWYTPSGRSISRPRSLDGADDTHADSTAKFSTRYTTDAGRVVLGGGGITPDIPLAASPTDTTATALQTALGKHIPMFRRTLTGYARALRASRSIASPDFVVTPGMRAELLRQMKSRGIPIDPVTFDRAGSVIDRMLGYEIARELFGESLEYERRVRDDSDVTRTAAIVSGATSEAEVFRRRARR